MRSIVLCIAGLAVLSQVAGAGVVVTSSELTLLDLGKIGTGINLSDLGGFQRSVTDTITSTPNVNLQDLATTSGAFAAASGLYTATFTYDSQNNLRDLVANGLAFTTTGVMGPGIFTSAQMAPVLVVNFAVAGSPVTYSITGATSASGGGQTQVILVQLGVVDTDIFRLTDPGLFSQTGQLLVGNYQLIYPLNAASQLTDIGSATSTASIGADITFTPEPATLLLIGLAAGGMLLRRRQG